MIRRFKVLVVLLLILGLSTQLFAAGGQAKEEKIVIRWPCIWVGADSKANAIKEIVDEYNAKNLGKIEVLIEAMPDYAVYDRKIVADIATGNAPDFFTLKWTPETKALYDTDILLDITKELDAGWGDSLHRDDVEATRINGKIKVLSYETAITPVWYNIEMFKRAGIAEFPKEMDEFWIACDKIKAIGIVPTSQMTGANNSWTTMLWYSHIMNSLGGPGIWTRPLTDPLFAQGAEIVKKMFLDGNTTADAIGAGWDIPSGHYMAGRTAVFMNGPWFIGRVRNDAPDIYEVTEVSAAPAAGQYKGSQVGFILTVIAAANPKDEAKRAAVIDFMKHLSDPENAKQISREAGSLLTPKFTLGPGEQMDPLQAKFINALNEASFLGNHLGNEFPLTMTEGFGPTLDALIAGKITAKEFGQQLADLMD
jgi:raffinose/stachyose/melibiose transport system substrate-binding protein